MLRLGWNLDGMLLGKIEQVMLSEDWTLHVTCRLYFTCYFEDRVLCFRLDLK